MKGEGEKGGKKEEGEKGGKKEERRTCVLMCVEGE